MESILKPWLNRMVLARDLVVGNMYTLEDTTRVQFGAPEFLDRLLDRPHLLIIKQPLPARLNAVRLIFQTDNRGGYPHLNPAVIVDEDQTFLVPQKSLSNVYRNKATEFGVRNTFERAGTTGYNPAANLIVQQATGVRYTPNPYLTGGKRRKTRVRKTRRRHSKKTRKH